jgi:hypothetical protein
MPGADTVWLIELAELTGPMRTFAMVAKKQ